MNGHVLKEPVRFGVVYDDVVLRDPPVAVCGLCGVLAWGETQLQGVECDLIVECLTSINETVFVQGLSNTRDLVQGIRFTLGVRGIGYGCEIIRPEDFGAYL